MKKMIIIEEIIGDKMYKMQVIERVCKDCKSFKKFATLRLEKENEKICSVCGKRILTK